MPVYLLAAARPKRAIKTMKRIVDSRLVGEEMISRFEGRMVGEESKIRLAYIGHRRGRNWYLEPGEQRLGVGRRLGDLEHVVGV